MAEKGDMNHHKALQEDVASLYERATSTLLKENVLLHFSFADFEEVLLCFYYYTFCLVASSALSLSGS